MKDILKYVKKLQACYIPTDCEIAQK